MERSANLGTLPKHIIVASLTALALTGCSRSEEDKTDQAYPLGANQPLYNTSTEANNLTNPCATLTQAITVVPASVKDAGGWFVLELSKSDISAGMTNPDACPGESVYTTFK